MDKTKKLCYNKYVIRNKKLITISYAPIGKWFEAIALSRLHHGFESRWEYQYRRVAQLVGAHDR